MQGELGGYLRVAYDAEEGEGKDVAERYNAIAFPTLLVLDADGNEVRRQVGAFRTGNDLARWLDGK